MRFPLWRRRQDDDLQQEVQTHLAMSARDRVERGAARAEAEAAARREFGNPLLVREITRDKWGWIWLEQLVQDVRFSIRVLAKSPAFMAIALLTLALGIGANTALFSVVNAVLLAPLPYPEPEQLVTLHLSKPNFDTGAIPFPIFRDWQVRNRSFSAMALSRLSAATLIGAGEPEYIRLNYVTSDFFPLLGVKPVIGRNFAPGEDEIGGPALAQISEGLWKRRFGATPDVLGKTLNLSGNVLTIVGVIPASFDLRLGTFTPTDIYVPMGQWPTPALKNRGAALGLHGIGRIKSGITLEQARSDMDAVSQQLAVEFPDSNRGTKTNMIPLKQSITTQVRGALLLLLGAVGFVLLIVCVNVATLLLARGQARKREFAVRAALGASRARILRQLLAEGTLLALTGGALGVLLAAWGSRAALRFLPQELPRVQNLHLDVRVLGFSLAVSMLTGIVFGLVPAFSGTRAELVPDLQGAGRRVSSTRHKAQRVLVMSEIAIALVLLVGAGLMVRSLVRLWNVDPGFDPHNVMAFGVALSPGLTSAKPGAMWAYVHELRDTIQSTPGIEAVSLRDGSLPMFDENDTVFWMAGQPRPRSSSEMNWTLVSEVQPSFLRIMKMPLLYGRFLSEQDTTTSPRVVVVDDVFASSFFPKQDALGKRIRWGDEPRDEAEIVGIVGHVKHWGLDEGSRDLRAQMYLSIDQEDGSPGLNNSFVVRTSVPPTPMLPALQERVRHLNQENVLFRPWAMEDVIARTLSTRKFSMTLLAVFALFAVLLAAIGIYGVVSYLVGQRTQEFGIRMALGARPRNVFGIVLGEGARMAVVGVAAGLLSAFALTRVMAKLLFGISATDPFTFAAVTVLLAGVALVACYLPARRAVRIDPMRALRYE